MGADARRPVRKGSETMRTVLFAFLIMVELGLLMLAVAAVQPSSLITPLPAAVAPTTVLPFGAPLPITPVAPAPPPDPDCPSDNVRRQSCETRYVSIT